MARNILGLQMAGAALLIVAAFGCGDDDTSEGTTSSSTTTTTSDGGGTTTTTTTTTSTGGTGGTGGTSGNGGSAGGVSNLPPTASFTMSPNCTMTSSTQITFTSTSTDPENDALTCSWVFGSGTPASGTGCTVSGVTFPDLAPYNVTLTVNDGTSNAMATMPIAPCP